MLDLPLHPLVVHLAVVALPVGALAVIATVLWPRVRSRYGTLALATLSVGALAAIAAKVTGEQLATQVRRPESHASFGDALTIVALATAALAWAWWWLERRRDAAPPGSPALPAMASGALTLTACVAVVGLTVATGHTGATAVWGGGAPATTPAPGTSAAPTYTLADVAQHNTAAHCWAAVDGRVYDLTDWIGQHPGGQQRIIALCGTDATVAFSTQHGGQARPASQLAPLQIGVLAP